MSPATPAARDQIASTLSRSTNAVTASIVVRQARPDASHESPVGRRRRRR